MNTLVEESLQIAAKKFENFGFQEEQVEKLLLSGRRDLEAEMEKLMQLLSEPEPDKEAIDKSLHALKGLLYNLGNIDAGDKMNDLREDESLHEQIEKLQAVLHGR